MDFHMLTRRDLQALCKRNKIPANITNVAMAESLKALEIVEGIEEFLQTCESETAESSIESPVRSELTSPYVPPTGGRSTRRRNVTKEEPETTKPSARAQRTTRRTLGKYADVQQVDAIETPAMVPQSNRRKVQISSACKKMDFQSKECLEEEKNGLSETPAPTGVTTRRRRGAKEESTVKRQYSTRRSTRLAEKNMELLNEAGNENLDFSKKDLYTNDCQESKMNLKDDLDEVSGITGVLDIDITVEETSEKKDEAEVISAEKQNISTIDKGEPVPTIEVEVSNQSEAGGAESELKENTDVEIEEVVFGSETEAEAKKEKCDETEAPNDENKADENDGSLDVQTSEIEEIEIEVEKIEQKSNEDAEYEDQAVNYGENDAFESEEKYTDEDAAWEYHAGNCGDNVVLKSEGSFDVQPSEIEIEVEKTEEKIADKDNGLQSEEQNTDKDAGCEDEVVICEKNSLASEDDFTVGEVSFGNDIHNELEENVSNGNDLDSEDVTELNANEKVLENNADVHGDSSEKEFNPTESDSLNFEAAYQNTEDSLSEMTFDISLMSEEEEVSKWDAVFAYVNEKHNAVEEKDETNLVKDSELELQQSAEVLPGKEMKEAGEIDISQPEENKRAAAADQAPYLVPPTCLTPKKKRITAVSDNKENIGGGDSKHVLTRERANIAKTKEKLGEMSLRKLTKMLKEQLQIKNENDTEVPLARTALQALPENR